MKKKLFRERRYETKLKEEKKKEVKNVVKKGKKKND